LWIGRPEGATASIASTTFCRSPGALAGRVAGVADDAGAPEDDESEPAEPPQTDGGAVALDGPAPARRDVDAEDPGDFAAGAPLPVMTVSAVAVLEAVAPVEPAAGVFDGPAEAHPVSPTSIANATPAPVIRPACARSMSAPLCVVPLVHSRR